MGMETEEEAEPLPLSSEISRSFSDPSSGTEWTAEVTGWSRSGVLPLRTVPILEIVFRTGEPDTAPQKRIVHQGESLKGFTEAELVRLLSKAEAYTEPLTEPKPKRTPSRKGRKMQPRN
jgi:hypothetical protein